jgi:S1-C subfamily serine protease
VIRITAPMHDGFAGGGVFDTRGQLTGIATAAEIRGFGVVVPASIAWASVSQVLTSGTTQRGFVGLAVQPVTLPPAQRHEGRERGLLVLGVTPEGPAETAGLMVGDVVLDFDGRATESPEDLLGVLEHGRVGETVTVRTLRGGVLRDVPLVIAARA